MDILPIDKQLAEQLTIERIKAYMTANGGRLTVNVTTAQAWYRESLNIAKAIIALR